MKFYFIKYQGGWSRDNCLRSHCVMCNGSAHGLEGISFFLEYFYIFVHILPTMFQPLSCRFQRCIVVQCSSSSFLIYLARNFEVRVFLLVTLCFEVKMVPFYGIYIVLPVIFGTKKLGDYSCWQIYYIHPCNTVFHEVLGINVQKVTLCSEIDMVTLCYEI